MHFPILHTVTVCGKIASENDRGGSLQHYDILKQYTAAGRQKGNNMTTKDQERKALAQIRKIVESLGENSYVATAFEGSRSQRKTSGTMQRTASKRGCWMQNAEPTGPRP